MRISKNFAVFGSSFFCIVVNQCAVFSQAKMNTLNLALNGKGIFWNSFTTEFLVHVHIVNDCFFEFLMCRILDEEENEYQIDQFASHVFLPVGNNSHAQV